MAVIHDHYDERRSLPGDKYGFGLMEHGDTILADTKIERDRVRAAFHIWKMSRGSAKRLTTYREGSRYRIELRDPAALPAPPTPSDPEMTRRDVERLIDNTRKGKLL